MPVASYAVAERACGVTGISVFWLEYRRNKVNNPGLKHLGLRLNPTHRARIGHHRLIDRSPLDIDRGVVIRRGGELTHDTTKLSLRAAVTAFGMPTGAASLAGV